MKTFVLSLVAALVLSLGLSASAHAFSSSAASLYTGEIGSSEVITNVRIKADVIESPRQILLSNIQVAYASSVSGDATELLYTYTYLAGSARENLMRAICQEFNARDVSSFKLGEPVKSDELGRVFVGDLNMSLQFEILWSAGSEVAEIREVVCSK